MLNWHANFPDAKKDALRLISETRRYQEKCGGRSERKEERPSRNGKGPG